MSGNIQVQYHDLDLKIHEDAYGDCWVEAIGAPGTRSKPVRLFLDDPHITEWVLSNSCCTRLTLTSCPRHHGRRLQRV